MPLCTDENGRLEAANSPVQSPDVELLDSDCDSVKDDQHRFRHVEAQRATFQTRPHDSSSSSDEYEVTTPVVEREVHEWSGLRKGLIGARTDQRSEITFTYLCVLSAWQC